MSKATITTLRLPEELLTRADALVPMLEGHSEASASGRVKNRSEVLRLALTIGLRELERTHAEPPKRPKRAR